MIKARDVWENKPEIDEPDPITESDYYEFDDNNDTFDDLTKYKNIEVERNSEHNG